MTLRELANTQWIGRGGLWLDPLGNDADISECSIEIQEAAIHYRWSYNDKPQTGTIALCPDGADFSDLWHSPMPMACI